jgi:hypothetical protein
MSFLLYPSSSQASWMVFSQCGAGGSGGGFSGVSHPSVIVCGDGEDSFSAPGFSLSPEAARCIGDCGVFHGVRIFRSQPDPGGDVGDG